MKQKKSLPRSRFIGTLVSLSLIALVAFPLVTVAKAATNFVTGNAGYIDTITGQYTSVQMAVSGSFTSDGLLTDLQHHTFTSQDTNGDWFTLDIRAARMVYGSQDATAWFAGQVTDANDATLLGKWYFVRVYDGGQGPDSQDTIYARPVGLNLSWPYSQGSFMVGFNMVAAGNMNGSSTPSTSGNIQIH